MTVEEPGSKLAKLEEKPAGPANLMPTRSARRFVIEG